MQWQDIVIAVIEWIFAIALIPTIRSADKPPLLTSLSTGISLLIMAFALFTLHLWNSAFGSSIAGGLWLMIGWQKYRQKKIAR